MPNMDYFYDHHAHIPPADPDTVAAQLHPNLITSHYLLQQSITFALPPASTDNTSDRDTEPLPHLDYCLLNTLISATRSHLDKHTLKRFDYLADARKKYYVAHTKVYAAHRVLLDSHTYHEMLEKDWVRLTGLAKEQGKGNMGPGLVRDMCYNELLKRKNMVAMADALLDFKKTSAARKAVAMEFGNMKWIFYTKDMPDLVNLGKRIYNAAMSDGELARPTGPRDGSDNPSGFPLFPSPLNPSRTEPEPTNDGMTAGMGEDVVIAVNGVSESGDLTVDSPPRNDDDDAGKDYL